MDLLANAVASIQMGVEDYRSADERRVLSALRNLYSGTILLLKQKLVRESPADSEGLLIYARLIPRRTSEGVGWKPKSKKRTINYSEIRERFEGLGLKIEWKRLDTLQSIRNEAEHYQLTSPRNSALEALAACFVLVKQIVEDHLDERPEHILGSETWQAMLAEADTFKATERQCRQSLVLLEDVPKAAHRALAMIRCPECSSALLQAEPGTYTQARFLCRTCGEDCDLIGVMPEAAERAYPREYDKKIGYVDSTARCPSCGEYGFVIQEDVCLVCANGRPYSECGRCGCDLAVDESDEPFCSYCNRGHDD